MIKSNSYFEKPNLNIINDFIKIQCDLIKNSESWDLNI